MAWRDELTREQHLVLASFFQGSGRGAQRAEDEMVLGSTLGAAAALKAAEDLRSLGLLVQRGDFWRVTDKGIDAWGDLTSEGRS